LPDYLKNSGFWKALVFSSSLFIASCSSYQEKDEHREYFEAIYKRIDSLWPKKDKAIELLDSAYNAFPNAGLGDLYSVDSIKLVIASVEHDVTRALAYADTLIDIAKQGLGKERYSERYVAALYFKGDCFALMKAYNESLRYYRLAKEALLQGVKNKCALINFDGREANLLFIQEKYILAANYYLKHYEELLGCPIYTYRYLMHLGAIINNAALSYLRAGLYDSAAYYQDSALNIIRRYEDKFPDKKLTTEYWKCVIYADLAEVLAFKGRLKEAESLYKRSIVGARDFDVPCVQVTQARLIELYFKENKRDSAEKVLSELKTSLDSRANETQLIAWHKFKIRNFTLQKKFDSVLSYRLKYDSLREVALSRDRNFSNINVVREFENLQLKYSNDILKKESKVKNQYLIISAIIFLMAVVIALQIAYSLKKTRKLNWQVHTKNEELQRAFTSLQQSHRENARIMKIVAHDLKNPISAMKNLAYSLLKKEPEGAQKSVLEIIYDSSMNSLALINDLLYEKKNLSPASREMVDIKKLLEQCVELLQAKANEKNQKLLLEAEPAFAFINVEKIWRVVNNIVNNAIKFSYTDAEIIIQLKKEENHALISVRDSGIGIPSAMADKIFSMTAEEGRPGTSGEKSHGLGLSISQKIIDEHEGKIWLESKEGKGAVFYIRLPSKNQFS
jgi:signal transduction histidine kinase